MLPSCADLDSSTSKVLDVWALSTTASARGRRLTPGDLILINDKCDPSVWRPMKKRSAEIWRRSLSSARASDIQHTV